MSFWEFSCTLYSHESVKKVLLEAQNIHRCHVTRLLLALYAASLHKEVTLKKRALLFLKIHDACLVRPIRRLRKVFLKKHLLELFFEKQQYLYFETSVPFMPDSNLPLEDLIRKNLALFYPFYPHSFLIDVTLSRI